MKNIDKNIKILENVEPYGIIKQNEYDFVTKEKYIQAQKDLIKAYKELEEENTTEFARGYTKCILDFNKKYIPVSLIKEKIKELKSKSGGNVFHIQQTINAEIRLLQELLEKRK